jgi:DNA-binding FadR family transcriptional regulator
MTPAADPTPPPEVVPFVLAPGADGTAAGGPRLAINRVRKAYEQVADQIRELILTGQVEHGARLPNETALAAEFGVSRATVREALRTLAAQKLIVTAKGAGGGTYVARPSFDYISELLHSNISLLTELHHISLEELLEARMHLEVPAARLAARRRSTDDLHRLSGSIPEEGGAPLRTQELFVYNMGFHSVLMAASGNVLLHLSALPLFTVLQTNLARTNVPARFHKQIAEDHRLLHQAIEEQDEDAAESRMIDHLQFLRPYYEQIWKYARRKTP